MVGGLGPLGGNNVLKALNFPPVAAEMGKLVDEAVGDLQGLLTSLQKSFTDAAAGLTGPTGQFGSVATGSFSTLIVRLAYIAILKNAMEKANQSKLFNVETAINDLWIRLEPLKRMGEATSLASGGGGAAAAQELAKLSAMIEKQGGLFRALSEMTRNYSEAARNLAKTTVR